MSTLQLHTYHVNIIFVLQRFHFLLVALEFKQIHKNHETAFLLFWWLIL